MLDHIFKLEDFAKFLGVNPKSITFFVYTRRGRKLAYREFTLPKRRGGARTLHAPCKGLQFIQRAILEKILNSSITKPRGCVYSYVKDRSTQDLASHHVGKDVVVKVDLQDFFGTIHFGRVLGALQAFPISLPYRWAVLVAQLCTFNKALPQGAPTSPALSNLICRKMDGELLAFAKQSGFHYSRYSDDLIFSATTRRRLGFLVEREPTTLTYVSADPLRSIIMSNGFALNESKTSVLFRNHKQMIVGTVCNRKVNVDRRYVRRIRTLLWLAGRSPVDALEAYKSWTSRGASTNIFHVLRGMIEYVRVIKGGQDPVFLNLADQFNSLSPADIKIRFDRVAKNTIGAHTDRDVFVCEAYHKHYGKAEKDYGDVAVLYKTGSCFFIEGIGLVTSFHNLYHRFEIFRADKPELKFQLDKLVFCSPKMDIAVFDGGSVWRGLVKYLRPETVYETVPGTKITVLGYPHYKKDDHLSTRQGVVTQLKDAYAMKLLVLDMGIKEGESGGPVINDRKRVVGLVRSRFGENLAIPISYVLDQLKGAVSLTTLSDWENDFTPVGEGARQASTSGLQNIMKRIKLLIRW